MTLQSELKVRIMKLNSHMKVIETNETISQECSKSFKYYNTLNYIVNIILCAYWQCACTVNDSLCVSALLSPLIVTLHLQ